LISAKNAMSGEEKVLDVIIIDTAGRLHIDDEMMGEIKELHAAIILSKHYLFVDSMTGQDAAHYCKSF